jgi:hypothetical protein
MSEVTQLNEHSFVIKSNALIEGRYRLSLQESHVVLWLLTKIEPDDEDFKIHKLKIDEFSSLVGLKADGQYGELQKITENLMKRILRIHQPETNGTLQVAWLSSARYQNSKGYVLLEFSPQLKPYLLQLKNHFTKINIADTLKLKSVYSMRVFELLVQYESIGKRTTTIENLRSWCGLLPSEYQFYADVKRRVIERAKTEINAKTEYEIDYTETKENRKVVGLEWTIKKKTHFEKSQEEKARIIQKELRSGNSIIQQLLEYGLTLPHSRKIVKDNDHEALVNAIKSVDIQVERGRAKNPKAMLIKAIQEKWHPEKFVDRKRKNS